MRVLIADDEMHARARVRELLKELGRDLPTFVAAEVANGTEAVQAALANEVDVALLDIHMPGMDGLTAARHLLRLPRPPAVIFLTAHDEHAVAAFELGALDYLLKPVRVERLRVSLQRARRLAAEDDATLLAQGGRRSHLIVSDRGRVLLVPLDEVLFLRAEEKYVVAQTPVREYLLNESLTTLEEEFGDCFLRIHRGCLVNRKHLAGFELVGGEVGRWQAVVHGWPHRLPVSRRQAHVVRIVRDG
jgi:two-component system, LytTR family, response regulator AlgR